MLGRVDGLYEYLLSFSECAGYSVCYKKTSSTKKTGLQDTGCCELPRVDRQWDRVEAAD